MDIKLISLTKNEPAEFAGAKKIISDCANAFNSEAEKFKNFSSPKRALLAISQALRSADVVIAAVQTSGYNSAKKMLFSALELETQQNDEIYAQLLPLCEKGKIGVTNGNVTPQTRERFVTLSPLQSYTDVTNNVTPKNPCVPTVFGLLLQCYIKFLLTYENIECMGANTS